MKTLRFSVVLVLMLTRCASIELESEFLHDNELQARVLDQTSDAFADIDPLFLSDELKGQLDSYIGYVRDERKRVELLQDFLYDEANLGIIYSAEKTHTAMELYNARSGNCLSAMNLYVAMARHLGIEARFQRVDVQPSWDKRGGLLVLSQHINATGRFDQTIRYVADFTPEIALQQLTSKVISDTQARALYFNNLGVEALVAHDYEGAIAYFKNALFLDPENAIAWNNVGAAFNRVGDRALAQYSYRTAFELDGNSATAIANLAKFYHVQGDTRRARAYELAIERFNAMNPYYHYAQGHVAYGEGDLALARKAFERALALKEEEPDFYVALGRIYFEQGDLVAARKLSREAEELVLLNEEIYRPSNSRLRVLERESGDAEGAGEGLRIIFAH
ncbi:MAG: tetratricopeptide repeat protein [OM182 bacterium]